MSLAIYPLYLGEVEIDFSFMVWQTNCGNPTYVPATSWLITGADKPILVDAGFRSAADVKAYSGLNARQSADQTLEAQLSRHNLKPGDIGYVVHTHLHLDHCGLDIAVAGIAPAGVDSVLPRRLRGRRRGLNR